MTSLDLNNLTSLTNFYINGSAFIGPVMNLTSLNLTGCTGLKNIDISATMLATLNVSSCLALENFTYTDNYVPNLDLSGLTHLQTIYVTSNTESNTLISLNANGCTALTSLRAHYNNQLQSIYMKNGVNETLSLIECPSLSFVCADESQLAAVQAVLNAHSPPSSAVCNSYCSFTPGGNYNTITGKITYDANGNGCDTSDPAQSNVKLNLGSPVIGTTFTNTSGNYTFYTNTGNFQWQPVVENPAWYTVSPVQGSTVFSNANNVLTQDFCISRNGTHPDLEVVISPIAPARPGFSAVYKIVYKNKGNQILSGNVLFTFDDSRLDFSSAVPAVDVIGTNSLSWAYSNLMPFENRAIVVTLTVSPPPVVNNGDILPFTAQITPVAGDEAPADNSFAFNQIVVGSFDPNDIICLEGPIAPPSEIGNYLHYVINFENTGSYYAENVVVKDVIDTNKYDISSLQLLNTSHTCYTRVTGNVVEFIFEHINLAAASGNPPVGGHGDVLFKIRSKNTLVEGDFVSKSGKIYFDYNMPIATNIEQTTFQTLSNGVDHLDSSISIYPNPANALITINCNSVIKTIELYDIQGRLLETDLDNANTVVIDISTKQNGIYFLKIKTEKGSKVEKVVKE
ncbi:MAG: T9SS type A sorting domain-containing protein [Flavobacterium sp.]